MNRTGRKHVQRSNAIQSGRTAIAFEKEDDAKVIRIRKTADDTPARRMPKGSGTKKSKIKISPVRSIPSTPRSALNSRAASFPVLPATQSIEKKTEQQLSIKQHIMMMSKACHVNPDRQDFAQHISNSHPEEPGEPHLTQYQNLLLEQYGFEVGLTNDMSELRKAISRKLAPKVEHSSQCTSPNRTATGTDGVSWQQVDTVEDVEAIIMEGGRAISGRTSKRYPPPFYAPKKVRISETPTIKVIAEKYSKIKKNNIELRKLEEKIVCVEYDVYDFDSSVFTAKPVQVMRAFFSIKTGCELCNGEKMISAIPSALKDHIQIDERDVQLHTEKEIEIIDEKIPENKPYLLDFKRVLKKKRIIDDKKKKASLDLQSMYRMAKMDNAPLDPNFSHTNLLSSAELEEMKSLILERCENGGDGICRRKMSNEDSKTESVFYSMLEGGSNL